ncbi:MAG: PIN domain-containing protein [Clostridia bacterium]|nr:PIN domain-containing protein [Clostridia bacterium]
MVLVDTSVWVSHLRDSHPRMVSLLNDGDVVCHPFIIGELSCGNLTNRSEILSLLHSLPMVDQVEHEEVLQFVEINDLMGRGLGYVDVHLLASAVLFGASIWTLDRKLRVVSSELGVCHSR